MRYKNHDAHLVILCTVLFSFLSIFMFYILINANNRISVINEEIDTLKDSNVDNRLAIENLKKQIAVYTYDLENKELKDKTYSDEKETKKLSVKKPIEKYKNQI